MTADPGRLAAALADRYTIDREIGEGGMATVYVARDIKHDRQVAIKVLRPDLAAVIGPLRFLAEIKTTANLQHPHILSLFDSGEVDGTVFYVMPYVDGESLRDRLARERQLPLEDALRIAGEVADALQYAHQHGVIHRDIKPENILLHGGHAQVADFGIALAASKTGGNRMTETGMSLGTPQYMSPEQAMGERELDSRTDIYALGCVTYEMLTGEPPFTGPTAQAIVARVMTEKPRSIVSQRDTVPAEVEDAVLRALSKLPADRFASAQDFAAALRSHPGTGGSRPVVPGTAMRWSAGRVAVAGLLVLAGIAGGFGLGRRGESGAKTATYLQKTFDAQTIFNARFGPDGQTIVFSAAKAGSVPALYIIRPDYPEARPLGLDDTHLLAISSQGDLAILTGARWQQQREFVGTLARVPLGGGTPRALLDSVREADWSPDGSQLAIIRQVGPVDQVEYPIGTVLYQSSGYVSDLRVSPDGKLVAIFEHPFRWDDRGSIVLVDRMRHGSVLARGFGTLEGLSWSRNGRSLIFSGSTAGTLDAREVDLHGHARHLLSTPDDLLVYDVSPDGHWLATQGSIETLAFGHTAGDTVDRDLSWRDYVSNVSVSSDGRQMAFSDAGTFGGNYYTTMIRGMDGSQAARLGEGIALMLSPDAQWLLASVDTTPPEVLLEPTGAGATRRLDHGEFRHAPPAGAVWGPGGDSVVACGVIGDHPIRCYLQTGTDPAWKPIAEDGASDVAMSVDHTHLVAWNTIRHEFRWYALSVDSGRVIPGLDSADAVIDWSADGSALDVSRKELLVTRVDRLDVTTGRRTHLESFMPRDRSGVVAVHDLKLARDPHTYVYVVQKTVSHLFTIAGAQ